MTESEFIELLTPKAIVKFWNGVQKFDLKGGNCWFWIDSGPRGDYPVFQISKTSVPVKRVSWAVAGGTTDFSKKLKHLCNNYESSACIRPSHLIDKPQKEIIAMRHVFKNEQRRLSVLEGKTQQQFEDYWDSLDYKPVPLNGLPLSDNQAWEVSRPKGASQIIELINSINFVKIEPELDQN